MTAVVDPPYHVYSGELDEPIVMAETPMEAFKKAFVMHALEKGLPRLGPFVRIHNLQDPRQSLDEENIPAYATLTQVVNPEIFLAFVQGAARKGPPRLPKKVAPPPPPPSFNEMVAFLQQRAARQKS